MHYGSDYEGARFYKVDLQVQTPGDRLHWAEPETSIHALGDQGAADALIRRCYEEGLEAIAVTDHNFASKDFIPFLRAAARSLAPEFGYRLIIFPGFEIRADVGLGCHVLGIFEPDADLDTIHHLVTACGVPMPRFAAGGAAGSTKRLP